MHWMFNLTFQYFKALSLSCPKSERKFLTFLACNDHPIYACGNLRKNLYCFRLVQCIKNSTNMILLSNLIVVNRFCFKIKRDDCAVFS